MKLKTYEQEIAGYEFGVMELPSGYISFRAPMGDNDKDKDMFDTLVYYNQKLYNGKTKDKQEIIERIERFITGVKSKQ